MIPILRRSRAASFLTVLAAGLALAACEGTNAFGPPRGGPEPGGGDPDTQVPAVTLEFPTGETTVAVGDSVFVRARVTDNVGLDSVVFTGFSLRGDPNLGTQQRVVRYQTKLVRLDQLPALENDTTLSRYLVATADSVAERGVMVVVAAYDTAGNVAADTATVSVGGPRVQVTVTNPANLQPYGGTQMTVRVQAEDRVELLRSVRVRTTGSFSFDSTLTFTTPVAKVDSSLVILIPNVNGPAQVTATAVSVGNVTGTARGVDVQVLPPITDVVAPKVTFDAVADDRMELDDSIHVAVSGIDETRVDSVGATVLVIRKIGNTLGDTLAVFHARTRAVADSFHFALSQVPLTGLDTATLVFEVSAYAVDPARNCGAATSTNTPQSQTCRPGPQGSRLAELPGKPYTVFAARGNTIAFPNPGDVIADVVADSARVYLSNQSRNRIEVLTIGSTTYGEPVRVGSQPWGLAIGRTRDSLYVANSGGTNISVIPLRDATLAEAQDRRIFTRNERLFSVNFSFDNGQVAQVTLFDYSDRPQFIAQAANGLLVYSTKPTTAAVDGTVRIYDASKLRSEIFIGYVDRHTADRAIVVNADSAFRAGNFLMVCPRRRFGDAGDPPCITNNVYVVADSLQKLRQLPANAVGGRWDTRVDIGAAIEEVGFADTTFVAASGDRRYVGVGEGVRQNARIPLFVAEADSLRLVGDVRDLISNTGERVIGLGLNRDGSLGVARGDSAYYFSNTARLEGTVGTGTPTGGVAQHPDNAGYPGGVSRLSFVSGRDAKAPYVDVIDNFSFFNVRRIYIRDPIVGALAVAPRAPGDPGNVALRLYGLTTRGIVTLRITFADLQ